MDDLTRGQAYVLLAIIIVATLVGLAIGVIQVLAWWRVAFGHCS